MAQLAAMPWDCEGRGFELTRMHLSTALRQYLDGALSTGGMETWANMVESREDVFFRRKHEREIEDVLRELANPAITQLLIKGELVNS